MHCRSVLTSLFVLTVVLQSSGVTADVYELRTYTTNEGRLDALNARFRDHTVKLFEKHGMTSVGYWVPVSGPGSKNTLIYVLKHKSRDAAKASWQAFLSDPVWKQVAEESQRDGRILAKAPDSVFMDLADYSPAQADRDASGEAVFELRVYRTHKDRLKNLDTRFRDHTMRLFQRHGMTSVAYWHPADAPDSDDTLIYILRHDSLDAAGTSWKSFRDDEEWQRVAKESQLDGDILRERPQATYMKATDYSALQ